VQTVKSFLEETLDAIPDSVLDKSLTREPCSEERYFADVDSMLPPRYVTMTNRGYGSPELVVVSI
jgi:tRNA-dihydrouridine synthase A